MSIAPCTSGPRHKWEWVKNVKISKFRIASIGTTGTFSLRGLYKCQCGSKKCGVFNPNEAYLRGSIQGATQ